MNGLQTSTIEGKMSLAASETGMIFMDEVVVPAENELKRLANACLVVHYQNVSSVTHKTHNLSVYPNG